MLLKRCLIVPETLLLRLIRHILKPIMAQKKFAHPRCEPFIFPEVTPHCRHPLQLQLFNQYIDSLPLLLSPRRRLKDQTFDLNS